VAFSVELTRPDDLLRLRIEGRNLRVEHAQDVDALVIDDATKPAFLLVHFPPQSIVEKAYYQVATVKPDDRPDAPPEPAGETPAAPGAVTLPERPPALLAGATRLVFKVPAGHRIALTTAGLLDWSALELNVHPIAAIGETPTPAQIAAAPPIARPSDTETAIELPYQLVVSPTAGVRWAHRLEPKTFRGRTELWHTRLQRMDGQTSDDLSQAAPASLRAIWSDDFGSGSNTDSRLGRTAMSPNDRYQIVVKTSGFHGYEGEAFLRLPRMPLLNGAWTSGVVEIPVWRPYVPRPFFADQLMLSSLGGWLRSRGNWPVVREAQQRLRVNRVAAEQAAHAAHPAQGPAVMREELARPAPQAQRDRLLGVAAGLRFDWHDFLKPESTTTFDLTEWQHIATQGRDHYVRIVYEGELLPFKNRAALVKVTERKFQESGGRVVANLIQRNFIVVREPEKVFGNDRGMPFTKVRITTTVTPDLADIADLRDASGAVITGLSGRSFWVEVFTAPTARARFSFHVVGTDRDGRTVDFTMPMLFLSRADDGDKRSKVIDAYNAKGPSAPLASRSASFSGALVRYVNDPAAPPSNNAVLPTRSMTFALDGETVRLLKADVAIAQVQELLGKDVATSIRLHEGFVKTGLDAASGVFAEVVEEVGGLVGGSPFAAVKAASAGVKFSSDKAGGFATPDMGIATLTQKKGPLAGAVADAVADKFDPAQFFPSGPDAARLFGTFELAKLLLAAVIDKGAPLMRSAKEVLGGKEKLVTTLEWTATAKDWGVSAAKFVTSKVPGNPTRLVVNGRIEKPLVVNEPVVSAFTGTLNDFSVVLLESVEIKFRSFGFDAGSGKKTSINVKLDDATPLVFTGDLSFVEELRKAIPPSLFDGATIDLQPNGIRAGFSFALPPITVAVFTLKDVRLGSSLTLPFLDGRPSLDFNVSERAHPFVLAVGIFGGGGFFHLQVDTAGLKLLEAALEFGATASIDLGVASGGVHIMAGIYFKLERKEPSTALAPTLSGYLRMGGYLSVLGLIKISLEFTLSFTYDGARDKAYGRATLTVQVEIAFFSTSVELTVERGFGGSNDPLFKELFVSAQPWNDYAEAFA
jgi:hypothetical protein